MLSELSSPKLSAFLCRVPFVKPSGGVDTQHESRVQQVVILMHSSERLWFGQFESMVGVPSPLPRSQIQPHHPHYCSKFRL